MSHCKSVFVLLCYLVLVTAKFADELSVTLQNGSPVRGHYKVSHSGRGIRSFTNIPFAEAPMGKLRFADPVPKSAWTEELGNSKEVIVCPQLEMFFFDGVYMGQEDCLYLNVHVPMSPKSKDPLPVMFFLHGGGFAAGSGSEILYGPEFLLDEDVILVAGNYRLGALGFLSTFTDEFSGNYGMKDQVLMLKWIQENIHVFGGDPKKVTIFGESAGAGGVNFHLLSPMSKGLFQQAIMHSGTAYETWASYGQTQSLKFAEKMLTVMGCEFSQGNYKKALGCMREKDPKDLVMNMKNFTVLGHHPLVIFTPVNEVQAGKAFIREKDYLNAEAASEIPLMIGVVADEGAFFVAMLAAAVDQVSALEKNFDEVILPILFLTGRFDEETAKQKVQLLKQHYFNGSEFNFELHKNQLVRMMTDIYFLSGFSRVMRNRVETKARANTFSYLFNYRGGASFTDIFLRNSKTDVNLGVSHVDDLFYLFPVVKNIIDFRIMTTEDHQVRQQMVKMWTNFAKYGNPSTREMEWTPAKKFPIDYMRIGNCNLEVCDPERRTTSAMQSGMFQENVKFIREFFNDPKRGDPKEEL